MSTIVDPSNTELLGMARQILAKGMSQVCHSLCCICFDQGIYINYGTTPSDEGVTTGTLEELKAPFTVIAEKAASPTDRNSVREFLDVDTLQQRLTDQPAITLTCRTADGQWSSAQFIVTERESDGSAKRALYFSEAVSIKKQEDIANVIAQHDTFIDSVTSVLNRTGYEQVEASLAESTSPVAYALVDVDHFKQINDSYGHAAGDAVLSHVAEAMRAIVRQGDDVARIGGDEFAVILNNCPASAAPRIMSKFESAQLSLSEALPDGSPVTLSVGICFSPAGLSPDVAKRADDAMYQVKAEGRGGCALVDEKGKVIQKWFDSTIDHRMDIAFANTVGSWRIEMPSDGSPRRMFCDDSMLRIAGEKRRLRSEEVYSRWRNGLMDVEAENIDAKLQKLSADGQLSHVSFTWTNEKGESLPIVSSIARDHSYLKGACFYGYFDLSRITDARRHENEVEMLNEALARSLVFGYVLDLEANTYTTLRKPASGPLSFIKAGGPTVALGNALRRFVANAEGKVALRDLLDRETMPRRLAGIDHVFCDFLSTGVQGWCRAKLYTFKAGGYDGLEKVILVGESIEMDDPANIEPPKDYPEKPGDEKAGRILVIDDEEINRAILEDALSDDFDVTCACDGAEAYELLKEQPGAFVGIVTDLFMPNMSGEELLVKLQQDGICQEVPVVVVTAEDKSESENRCLSHGAIDFIRKPIHVPAARSRVHNVVDLFKLQHNLKTEVERRTDQLQRTNEELEDKSRRLSEYAFRLSESSARMIESLGEIVEFRSFETGQHVTRVKHYTQALAENLLKMDPDCGLTEKSIQLLTEASPLHDVGKIAIPDNILLKPGRLTDEEFECMKTHTTRGLELLSSLDTVWEEDYRSVCEEIALCHHERYDGSGYPNGLKGEEIPLSAQIVSVADVFDALSSDRVYRPALSRAETYKLIMEGKVGSFSDRILRCFEETFPLLEQIARRIESENI